MAISYVNDCRVCCDGTPCRSWTCAGMREEDKMIARPPLWVNTFDEFLTNEDIDKMKAPELRRALMERSHMSSRARKAEMADSLKRMVAKDRKIYMRRFRSADHLVKGAHTCGGGGGGGGGGKSPFA
jgi:hypothetical protein